MTKHKPKLHIAATVQKFTALLKWHMSNGTRPETGTEFGERWRPHLLAKALRCDPASIRNWRHGRSRPLRRYADGLANIFFGGNPSLQEWRSAFLDSWRQDCFEHHYQGLPRSFLMKATPNNGAARVDKKSPEAVRHYVIAQLSDLCRTLELPLSGVDSAASHLLGAVTHDHKARPNLQVDPVRVTMVSANRELSSIARSASVRKTAARDADDRPR